MIAKNTNRFGKTAAISFLLVILTLSVFAQTTNLLPNRAAEKKSIEAKQIDVYQIALKKGEFAQIRVEQKGTDAAVSLFVADAGKIIERDTPNGIYGWEIISFVAEREVYKFEVKTLDENASPGKYSIALITKPQANENDLLRIEAERNFQNALELRKQNTPESNGFAAKEFDRATAAFRKLDDKYFESLVLSSAVFLDAKPETEEKSINELRRAVTLAKEAGDEYLALLTTSNIGDFYQQINQPEKARKIYEQTAENARQANDIFNERYALSGLAGTYQTAENWRKVAEIYEQKILPLVRKGGNRTEEADWLNFTGIANSFFDNERAAEFYLQADKIYHDLKNADGEAETLQNLGAAYFALDKKDKALENYEKAAAIAKAANLDQRNADALVEISYILSDQEKYDELLAVYDEIITLFQKTKDRAGEAEYWNLSAIALGSANRREKAFENYQKSLEIYRELGDKPKQALLLRNIAINYEWLDKKDEAADYYRKSAKIRIETGETGEAVKSLENIFTIFWANKKKQEAINVRKEILALYQNAKDQANEAVYLNRLGVIYSELNDRAKSLEYYNRAAAVAEKTDNKKVKAQIFYNIAAEYSVTGRKPEAVELFQKSLSLRRELGLKAEETDTLNRLSDVYAELRKSGDALEYAQKALEIAREIKNQTLVSKALNNLGRVYGDLQNFPASVKAYQESLKIADELNDKTLKSFAVYGLSLTYYEVGNTTQALETGREALVLSRETEDQFAVVAALDHIAAIYVYLGQYQKAIEFLEEVLGVAKKIGSSEKVGLTLGRIGGAYSELGNNEKAIKYSLDALPYLHDSQNIAVEATTLINLGGFYALKYDYPTALKYINEGLQLSRGIGDKVKQLGALLRLALISYQKNDAAKSREYLVQALTLAREANDKDNEAITLNNLLTLEKYYGDKNLAIFYGKQAVNLKQEIRANIKGIDKDLQQSYTKKSANIYRNLADLLIEQGRIPEAQAVLDLLKREEFGDLIKRSSAASETLPYSKAEEAAIRIVERLAAIGRELGELKEAKKTRELSQAENERLDQIEFTEIPAANNALRKAAEQLAKAAPDIQNALDNRMKDNIQTILPELGKGVAAIYTVFGQISDGLDDKKKTDVGWILLITPEFRKAYPIDTKDLNKTVADFRNVLKSDVYDPQPLAEKLYKKLFLQTSEKQKTTLAADLETYLGNAADKTLMWSLDGVLRYVPMAALHDGKQYLVEKYRNVIFNTASLGSLKDAAQTDWKVLGLGVSEAKIVDTGDGQTLSFDALKGAEAELRSIVKDANDPDGILPGTIQLNKDFTKIALLKGVRVGNPVIHIASHFSYNPANEEESFLLLGDGTPLKMSEFRDFPNLFANVDLLSLSACDTATGGGKNDNTNGKEVEGFAYVAQILGAKSVMASLWQVSDAGTKELMLNFYRIRQANPQITKAEALREAQISLLKGKTKAVRPDDANRSDLINFSGEETNQPKYKMDKNAPLAHPYYWSPFILIGNWK